MRRRAGLAALLWLVLGPAPGMAQGPSIAAPEQASLMAAAMGREDPAAYALQRGANVDAVDRAGNTALALAAKLGNADIVDMLLLNRAKVDAPARDGWTALEAAEMTGDDEIMELLKRAGARARRPKGATPQGSDGRARRR